MDNVKISKFLSLILRHKPETANINLDSNGWTDVNILLTSLRHHEFNISLAELKTLVATNDKKRFEFNDNYSEIRAAQGHSVEVDLKLPNAIPPDILYHGTVQSSVNLIKINGLTKMSRQQVHLSKDIETATIVGKRRGNPIILQINAKQMNDDGFKFSVSSNGVWLIDQVPSKYIIFL